MRKYLKTTSACMWIVISLTVFSYSSFADTNESIILAQLGNCSVPVNGRFQLRWSAGPIIHDGTLIMNGCYGSLITKYFDSSINKPVFVEQAIKVMSTSRGMLLRGYNPRLYGTNIPHPSYSPDNFLFQQTTSGNWNISMCDNNLVCSPVEILGVTQ